MKLKILRILVKATLIITILLITVFAYIKIFYSYTWHDEFKDIDTDGVIDRNDNDVDGDGISNLQDTDADGDGFGNKTDIILNARKLKGTMYEYLSGGFHNIGGRLGFLVCFDVPRIAYQNAGIPLDFLLKEDFQKDRYHYNEEGGRNTPDTPFFFRRTRNLYAYCEANGKLIKNCKLPKAGDVIFYGRSHITLISEVHEDGTYNEIETAPWTYFVVEHKNKKWADLTVGRILD